MNTANTIALGDFLILTAVMFAGYFVGVWAERYEAKDKARLRRAAKHNPHARRQYERLYGSLEPRPRHTRRHYR